MFIRAQLWANVFTSLAASWFVLVLITPRLVASDSPVKIVLSLLKPLSIGIINLLIAELILRLTRHDTA